MVKKLSRFWQESRRYNHFAFFWGFWASELLRSLFFPFFFSATPWIFQCSCRIRDISSASCLLSYISLVSFTNRTWSGLLSTLAVHLTVSSRRL